MYHDVYATLTHNPVVRGTLLLVPDVIYSNVAILCCFL